jgi:hypothetical protein
MLICERMHPTSPAASIILVCDFKIKISWLWNELGFKVWANSLCAIEKYNAFLMCHRKLANPLSDIGYIIAHSLYAVAFPRVTSKLYFPITHKGCVIFFNWWNILPIA